MGNKDNSFSARSLAEGKCRLPFWLSFCFPMRITCTFKRKFPSVFFILYAYMSKCIRWSSKTVVKSNILTLIGIGTWNNMYQLKLSICCPPGCNSWFCHKDAKYKYVTALKMFQYHDTSHDLIPWMIPQISPYMILFLIPLSRVPSCTLWIYVPSS